MNENAPKVHIYSSGSTEVADVDNSLANAKVQSFETQYPGGLFGSAQIFCARDVTLPWQVKENQRVVIKNGLTTVYEGRIVSIQTTLDKNDMGMLLLCSGYWGDVLEQRHINKRWADDRIDENVWIEYGNPGTVYAQFMEDKFTVERVDCLKFVPKGVAIALNEYVEVDYFMPIGQTVKRVVFDYELSEGAQAWQLAMFDYSGNGLFDLQSSATAGTDITLATPSTAILFLFRAGANQTPTEDGVYRAIVNNLVVYSEMGAINLTEICKDVAGSISDISTDTSLISSVGIMNLTPFITNGYEKASDILIRASSYGDAFYDAWAVGVRESDLASDGKPILFAEQQPALTDYDYAIRLDETNVSPPITFVRDLDSVVNYVIVRYERPDGRGEIYITPDDNALLKDTTSITSYGQREIVLDAGHINVVTAAPAFGRRYLLQHKDPKYYVSAPIKIIGTIRAKSGNMIPVSQIRAGKRLKIENFLGDLSGTGLTFLITQTSYECESETNSVSVGFPDNLAVWLARYERYKETGQT